MTVAYTLTPQLRIKLKDPFGTLIQGAPTETVAKLKVLVEQEKPPKLISVGDVVSLNLHKYGLHPELSIIDNISLRDQKMPQETNVEKTVHVVNPQGAITFEAISAVEVALGQNGHVHIVVDGEEDLLTLIAVLYAPEGSFVVYGQPYVGIVVVKASFEKKAQVKEFLKTMKP